MRPTSEKELCDAIAGATGPLALQGGGTRDLGRPVEGAPLDLTGLSGIRLYEPGALTLVAGAGTPLAEIEALLASEGQRLAFEPMDHRPLLGTQGAPTLGGAVAANASGPRRFQAGACRDHLLGLRFVDGRGQAIKNGGRVMKNVTGYDLVKLMAGSWGTLGALSEVSLKVLPTPEQVQTLEAEIADFPKAHQALISAVTSPYEVTGAAFSEGRVRLRLEGFEVQIRHRAAQLKARLAGLGDWAAAEADPWADIRDMRAFAGRDVVWRIALRPSRLPAMIAELGDACDWAVDQGGALLWVAGEPSLHEPIMQAAPRAGGHATLVKAPPELRARGPVFQPEPEGVRALSAAIRAKFDPRGILNPGRMG